MTDKAYPTIQESTSKAIKDSGVPVWTPQDKVVCVCANVYANAANTGFWDMWLTTSGAVVYTPCLLSKKFSPAEVALADFTQTQKINRAETVIALADDQNNIEDFVAQWVSHAFTVGKAVYTDVPIDTMTHPIRVRGGGLLRELQLYPLTKDGWDAHQEAMRVPGAGSVDLSNTVKPPKPAKSGKADNKDTEGAPPPSKNA